MPTARSAAAVPLLLGNDLLGFPGSYELRGEIRASLGDLRRSVGKLQPVAAGGGFY